MNFIYYIEKNFTHPHSLTLSNVKDGSAKVDDLKDIIRNHMQMVMSKRINDFQIFTVQNGAERELTDMSEPIIDLRYIFNQGHYFYVKLPNPTSSSNSSKVPPVKAEDSSSKTVPSIAFRKTSMTGAYHHQKETPKLPKFARKYKKYSKMMRFAAVTQQQKKPKEATTANDIATEKWNAKIDTLWPWKGEIIDDYKHKVEFSSFYYSSGSGISPYGTPGATKMVLQMNSIFMKVLEMARMEQMPIEEAMKFAEAYRKTIHRTTEDIVRQSDSSDEAFYADSLIVADILWGLVESVLIRPNDRSIVADLLEWANETFGQARELFTQIEKEAASESRIEEKDYYWSTVISLLLVGQFRSASTVLSLTSGYRHNMKLQKMTSILSLFNYEMLHSDSTGNAFEYAQKQVRKHIESFSDDEPLHFICKMLLGDLDTFKQTAESLSRQWYELLPAYILFSQPAATFNDLGRLTLELYNAIGLGAPRAHTLLNNIVISLMKMDWIQALSDLASVSSLLWLSVHLFDLILKIEGSKLTEEIESIRDTVFITYAKELFRTPGNPKLIECAVTYAFSTKEYKHDFVEPFLIIIAQNDGPSNAELINVLTRLCKEYGLYEAYHQITLALACKGLREKDWSATLHWAIQNESLDVMDTISYFVLLNADPASIKAINVFKNDNEIINQSDAMNFLFHFYQFNIALEARDIPKCASLLHDLIISNLAPPEFVHVLFDNIAEVIDATNRCLENESLLNMNAISKLQRCVTLYQQQEEVRSQGSSRRFDNYERIDKKLTFLHAVLLNAYALAALK